jgi:hypothetical protein
MIVHFKQSLKVEKEMEFNIECSEGHHPSFPFPGVRVEGSRIQE